MLHFLNPPPQPKFTTKILWLTQRYVTILPKRKPKKHNPNNNHQTLHPSTLQALIETYNITHSYYSSPLTCPITITQYNSPHNRDIIFGSTGHTHSSKWAGVGLAHPPYLKTAITSIYWARMAAQENHNTKTVVIINHKKNPLPITHTELHTIVTIPPNTIQYNLTSDWPKYLHQLENQYTTILSIQNPNPPDTPQVPHALESNIWELYNIKMKNHPPTKDPHPSPRKRNEIFHGMACSLKLQPSGQ